MLRYCLFLTIFLIAVIPVQAEESPVILATCPAEDAVGNWICASTDLSAMEKRISDQLQRTRAAGLSDEDASSLDRYLKWLGERRASCMTLDDAGRGFSARDACFARENDWILGLIAAYGGPILETPKTTYFCTSEDGTSKLELALLESGDERLTRNVTSVGYHGRIEHGIDAGDGVIFPSGNRLYLGYRVSRMLVDNVSHTCDRRKPRNW